MGEGENKETKKKEEDKIVLKVNMHCEDCRRRVKKALIPFTGIEEIDINMKEQKVTLKGKADLKKLVEAVRKKSKRQTELIYPVLKKEDKKDDKKDTSETTLELKVVLHCEECANKVRELLFNMDGVSHVKADVKNDKVIVKGKNIDGKKVCDKLHSEIGKHAQIIPPKKEEKKKEEKKEDKKEEKEKADKKEGKKEAVYVVNNYYHPDPFPIFNDENPNGTACSIM